MKTTEEDRFWAKVNKTETCWLWTGCIQFGYGIFHFNGKAGKAHRYSYILHFGSIPEGTEIDHVKAWGCTNKHCVNPAHLEAVTHKVNLSRRFVPKKYKPRKKATT